MTGPAAVASSHVHGESRMNKRCPAGGPCRPRPAQRQPSLLLKLSGEAFAGGGGLGVDPDVVHAIAREIAAVVRDGTEVPW